MSRAAINISWNAFIVPCDTFHNNFLEIFLKASNFYSNICSILCRTDSFFRELVLSRIRNEMNLKIINETCWKIAINKFCIRKTSFQWFMLRNGRQNIKKKCFPSSKFIISAPALLSRGKEKRTLNNEFLRNPNLFCHPSFFPIFTSSITYRTTISPQHFNCEYFWWQKFMRDRKMRNKIGLR